MVFVLNMVLHPDIQATAQGQLDAVTGNGRPPTFADRPKCPFIDQVLQEVYR